MTDSAVCLNTRACLHVSAVQVTQSGEAEICR